MSAIKSSIMLPRMTVPAMLAMLFSGFIALDGHGNDSPAGLTHNLGNGRLWMDSKASDKLYYAIGISDGVRWTLEQSANNTTGASTAEQVDTLARQFFVDGFTHSDYVKELDKLFADPANALLPIPVVYGVASDIFRGMPPDETQRRLARLRKIFARPENHANQ